MTREEAKELLTDMMMSYVPKDQYGDYGDPEPYEQAYDMAIEALQFAEHFDLLKEFQSLQEVVRCRDCRHCSKHYDRDGYPYWICDVWDSETDAEGFCHYGERREP